jgi:hypothetical protein
MSTRSRIGIELSDGSILSAYHHHSGYTSWLGRILQTHYTTKELVTELIDGGDMTCCWTDERWTYEGAQIQVEKYGPQYYVRQIDGECPPRLDKDLNEFFSNGEEYSYIFRNGNWYAFDMHQFEDMVAPEPIEIPAGALAV